MKITGSNFKTYLVKLNKDKSAIEKEKQPNKIIKMCEKVIKEIDDSDLSGLNLMDKFKLRTIKTGFEKCLHVIKSQSGVKQDEKRA